MGEYGVGTYFVQNVCRRGFIVGDCVSWPEHAYVVFHPCLNQTADFPSCRTKNVWEWAIASELSGYIAPLHIQGCRPSKRKGEEKEKKNLDRRGNREWRPGVLFWYAKRHGQISIENAPYKRRRNIMQSCTKKFDVSTWAVAGRGQCIQKINSWRVSSTHDVGKWWRQHLDCRFCTLNRSRKSGQRKILRRKRPNSNVTTP